MLVLTRKLNEEILIGDNVKITLLRMQGGSVRIGIEAPREVRIVRGELERHEDKTIEQAEEFDVREEAFAHPLPPSQPANPLVASVKRPTDSALFVGTVKPSGADVSLKRSPLASFVQAS